MRKSTGPSKPLAWPGDTAVGGAVQGEGTKKCPHCAQSLAAEATRCDHCQQDVPVAAKKDPWDGYDV